jgi:type VI secretion system protein ImpH
MADPAGPAAPSIIQELCAAAEQFDFMQALRRIECAYPSSPPIGHSARATEDPVRFGQMPSLRFAPSMFECCECRTAGLPPRLLVNGFGLLGPNGPMPLPFTEYVRDRLLSARDPTLARFLDIFHHRMISLFYDAWARNHPCVSFERGGDHDRFSCYIASFFGMGMPSFLRRDSIPDHAKHHYSGRLACQTRNAEGLQALLCDYFKIPVSLVEFVGQWLPLPERYRCRLGESHDTGRLGVTAVVGASVWECQQKFRVRLGPMALRDYLRMLPDGDSFQRLRDWLKTYAGYSLSYDVQLILKAEEVPRTCLGNAGKLGWTTWLGSHPHPQDATDLIVRPAA